MRELPLPTRPVFTLNAREAPWSLIRNNDPSTSPAMHKFVLTWLGFAVKKAFSKPRA